MPTERLSMRRIREVLRLRHQGLTERVIARMIGVSNGVVHGYLRRARLSGLTWPLPAREDTGRGRKVYKAACGAELVDAQHFVGAEVLAASAAREIMDGQQVAERHRQTCGESSEDAPDDAQDEPGEAWRRAWSYVPTSAEI